MRQDFDKFVVDEATRLGVQLFLKELERDKYRVCSGAFTEVSHHHYTLPTFSRHTGVRRIFFVLRGGAQNNVIF